jgi:hypothetical protein
MAQTFGMRGLLKEGERDWEKKVSAKEERNERRERKEETRQEEAGGCLAGDNAR